MRAHLGEVCEVLCVHHEGADHVVEVPMRHAATAVFTRAVIEDAVAKLRAANVEPSPDGFYYLEPTEVVRQLYARLWRRRAYGGKKGRLAARRLAALERVGLCRVPQGVLDRHRLPVAG